MASGGGGDTVVVFCSHGCIDRVHFAYHHHLPVAFLFPTFLIFFSSSFLPSFDTRAHKFLPLVGISESFPRSHALALPRLLMHHRIK